MASPRMVDVGGKPLERREAVAKGRIYLRRETVERIRGREVDKGDVEQVASIAALMGVKRTWEQIPLTHPIPVTACETSFSYGEDFVEVTVRVKAEYVTGVEIEALVGVMNALITIWDMVKKYEKDASGQYPHTSIGDVRVVEKVKGAP